jgi:PAS domain S-box-containing protein
MNVVKTMETTPRDVSNRELIAPALLGDGAECAEMGISIYDDDGKYVAVNRYACELLGYGRDELLDHDVADFTPSGIDRSVLLTPKRREGVRLVTCKDGSIVPVAFVVTPTLVSGIAFYISAWWKLDDDDPRVANAV